VNWLDDLSVYKQLNCVWAAKCVDLDNLQTQRENEWTELASYCKWFAIVNMI